MKWPKEWFDMEYERGNYAIGVDAAKSGSDKTVVQVHDPEAERLIAGVEAWLEAMES